MQQLTVVTPCTLPAGTNLSPEWVDAPYFSDAYRVSLTHPDHSVIDIFFAVFGHHPAWLKAILLMRNRVGAWFGLHAASTEDLLNPRRAKAYRVGQTIGPWPVFFVGENELVAGRDNTHLDFRLSVLKEGSGASACAVVSTVCRPHNRSGRVYISAIAPFHKWGVQWLLRRAARAGRL